MKFGKTLVKAMHQSDPEWAPFFMNYKFLKKKIKEIKVLRGDGVASASSSTKPHTPSGESNEAIAAGAGEKMFFRALHAELRKTTDFYKSLEQEMKMRYARISEGVRQLREMLTVTEETFDQMLMAACLKLYKDLLMLENYAIMNFCGFSKILKKHDKNTGFKTRDRFMINMVSVQPFTRYELVQELISQSEHLFTEVSQLGRSEQPTKLSLQTEERLFIEAILDMRSQGVTLRSEEEKPSTDTAVTGKLDSPRRGTPGEREAEAEDQAIRGSGRALFGSQGGSSQPGRTHQSLPSASACVLQADSPLKRVLLAGSHRQGTDGKAQSEPESHVEQPVDGHDGDEQAFSDAADRGRGGVECDVAQGVAEQGADVNRTGGALDITGGRKRAAEGAVEEAGSSLARKQKV